MVHPKINIQKDQIEDFCRRWKIKELALFGSVLREDFRPDSHIDALVTFEPDEGILLVPKPGLGTLKEPSSAWHKLSFPSATWERVEIIINTCARD